MNPFLHVHTCRISTLTPVHIGCGEDYYPSNYVIDGGVLYHFGDTGLLAALDGNELKQLAQLAERRGDDGIRQLQAFIHDRKDKLRAIAGHAVPVADGVAQLYAERIGQTAQRESGGRNVQNKLAIQRSAYNPLTQTPYLPGSSVKGAMRTAILDFLNDGRALPAQYQGTPTRPAHRDANRVLQQDCLGYQSIPQDPLSLLKISDASYRHADGLHGLEVRFAVNRKRHPSKNPSTSTENGPPILLECLPANRSCGFQVDIAFHDSVADPRSGKKKALPFRDIRELAERCNAFYSAALKDELDLLEDMNFGNPHWLNGFRKLLGAELAQALKDNRAFLLRVGKHSGAESVTLKGVRHIFIKPKKGQPPKYLDHTTCIRLAADHLKQQHGLLPFGWLLVELPGCELPQTQAFLKQQAEPDYRLLEQEQARQAQAQQARAEQEWRQAEAERKAREQAEREAAEQARLAAMSPEMQRVEQFHNFYQEQKSRGSYQPGSQFDEKRRAFFQEALDWQDSEARRAAAALLRETIKGWTDWPAKKERKAEFRAWLEQLESRQNP